MESKQEWELYNAAMNVKRAYERQLIPVLRKSGLLQPDSIDFSSLQENFYWNNEESTIGINFKNLIDWSPE